jgi:hypothetical protein
MYGFAGYLEGLQVDKRVILELNFGTGQEGADWIQLAQV